MQVTGFEDLDPLNKVLELTLVDEKLMTGHEILLKWQLSFSAEISHKNKIGVITSHQ
jgi:hypothetical protein